MTLLHPICHIVGHGHDIEILGTEREPVIVNKTARTVIKLHYRRRPEDLAKRLLLIGELIEAGANLLPPASMPIVLDQDWTATIWPVAEPCQDLHLARALAKLHSVNPAVISQDALSSLTAFEIDSRTQSRLSQAQDRLPSSILAELRARADQAKSILQQTLVRPRVILHGNAHADNLMQYQGQPVLVDLDDLATGVPEIDLAAAYTAHVRFQTDRARWDTFKADYGDADWELVARLRKMREATMVLWLATIKGAEAELEHRLSTFDTDQAWHRV